MTIDTSRGGFAGEVDDDPVRDELRRARAIASGLDARADVAEAGSETQRAMRLGARVARRQAFRTLIEHWCGPGAYRELGFAAPSRVLGNVARPVTCTCRNRRPIGELALEAGVGLDLQEARTAGFTSCGAAGGCVND